jgi:farnesyl diphosphate synthase
MDNDDIRRGVASCHVKFNESSAVLAGDALQSLAFEVLSKKKVY